MKKKSISILLTLSLVAVLFYGCGKKAEALKAPETIRTNGENSSEEEEVESEEAGATGGGSALVKFLTRPSLVSDFSLNGKAEYDENLVPSIPSYSVDTSFSNVINGDMVSGEHVADEFKQKLADNLFVVDGNSGYEFWEEYEFNAYSQTPNFVTVDSLMHTYHLYFAYLLKTTEKTYLSDSIQSLCMQMYEKSNEIYDECKGTDWEKAAEKNVEYFAVACSLSGVEVDVPSYAKDVCDSELSKIMDAGGIDASALFPDFMEDYSQYKPRGYYEGDAQLEKYFRTMMWLGRITFNAADEDSTKAAVLMCLALNDGSLTHWENVYAVTSFFAGASDDLGYCEYMPAIEDAYGKDPEVADVVGDNKGFGKLQKLIEQMDPPQIQSIPVFEDEENVIPGFRLMGQRFTIDANIMQNLIYRAVEANANDEMRLLPSVLDVPAALGSDAALEIANANGASAFPDYAVNMDKLRENLKNSPDSIWTVSLYAQWLNTLRPLLTEKGEGCPSFMQNKEWTKKSIETFAGSYTELKHDTVLYGKQPMAEMGGGDLEPVDDRGYVQPEPLVYSRFSALAAATAEGLMGYGMISDADADNLYRLSELADKLMVIAQKELKNELPTDEEFDLIRNYGGNIEHFWHEAMKAEADDEYFTTEEFPSGLVVDVATDPNGQVLEAGTGNPCAIYVIVPVDGILRIATGSVYDFYEFPWPLSDRLTDTKWREMIGAEPGAGYLYEVNDPMDKPEWTLSYRAERWNGWW